MTYHVPLQYSKDFTKALKNARIVADYMSDRINSLTHQNSSEVKVFPYSFFYVYYEQYLTIWRDALINIFAAIFAIFLVAFVFLSFNLVASLVIVLTIISIVTHLFGAMYLLNISFNAISLVNLVMVGHELFSLHLVIYLLFSLHIIIEYWHLCRILFTHCSSCDNVEFAFQCCQG